ncbi:hypothetical protein CH363_19200 [Leptospira haakeii]|uniref:Uncharacterized protein n=2 Tax=Leptospira haakeii TaxID=2023198 RepID=A0ABX4PEY6_9LEPT|nr:hypothetical protein CH363_19125 [Leptospira haakeii]PKA14327.1 hypothetical protein CH363_19200 [Leptospira haakeii]PKA18173.1 hypothetical protein CH377_18880 [Leptospira haakeii]PKA18185.1 hypothetical protein CH377_18955 [Leptospira haakeii]
MKTGEIEQVGKYRFAYKFDSSIISSSGDYVFLFEKYGTKGILLKNGEILREINRSYYHANDYEYPASFLEYQNKTYLVHCPMSYCQLDFEDVETGNIVTQISTRKPSDIFHSRLEVSQNNEYLISKGWIWHPIDIIQLYNIKECFNDPSVLDKEYYSMPAPDLGREICTASFIGEDQLLIGSSNEEEFDSDRTDTFPAKSFAIYNYAENTLSAPITPDFRFGNLVAINERQAWDTIKYPKIIDLGTGNLIHSLDDIDSGIQSSSILQFGINNPPLAFDNGRERLAVVAEDSTIILSIIQNGG